MEEKEKERRKGKVRRLRPHPPALEASGSGSEPEVAPPAPPVIPPVAEPAERPSEPPPPVTAPSVEPKTPPVLVSRKRLTSDWRAWAVGALVGLVAVIVMMTLPRPATTQMGELVPANITFRVELVALTHGETVGVEVYDRHEGKPTLVHSGYLLWAGDWVEARVSPGYVYVVPDKAGLVASPPPTVDGRGNLGFLVPEDWERGKPFVVTLSSKK